MKASAVWRRGCFGLVVLVSLVVLFAPGSAVPGSPAGTDKIVHASLFLALALSGRYAGLPLLPLAIALPAYAAASEIIQALAPINRDGTVGDFLTDVAGAAIGLAVAVLLPAARPNGRSEIGSRRGTGRGVGSR